jgi:hypothetical protein
MTGARQMIAVIITFIKSKKNLLECWAGAYQSSSKRNINNVHAIKKD